MKVFLTGATGFVGSHLARLLVQEGHEVHILRRSTSRLEAIRDLALQHHVGDLLDGELLRRLLAGVDWVFHTAAVADYWRQGKAAIYQTNVDATRVLLEASEAAGVRRFIFTSSGAAMGHSHHAATEESYFNVDPRLSPYGHSKFLAEAEVYRAVKRGLEAVILNPVIVIGPGDLNVISGSLIVELVQGRVPVMPQVGGTAFIDVRDVAKGHLAAAERGRSGERYLLGSVNLSYKAFIRLIAAVTGAPAPWLPAPPIATPLAAVAVDIGRALGMPITADGNQLRLSGRNLYFDCSKAWRELHVPEIDIRQSIRDTYEWYQAHGYL